MIYSLHFDFMRFSRRSVSLFDSGASGTIDQQCPDPRNGIDSNWSSSQILQTIAEIVDT
jgi:hypothetical protein